MCLQWLPKKAHAAFLKGVSSVSTYTTLQLAGEKCQDTTFSQLQMKSSESVTQFPTVYLRALLAKRNNTQIMHVLQFSYLCLTSILPQVHPATPLPTNCTQILPYSPLLGEPNQNQAFFQAWCLSPLLYWVYHKSPLQFASISRPSADSTSTLGRFSLTKRNLSFGCFFIENLVSHTSKFLSSPTTYVF